MIMQEAVIVDAIRSPMGRSKTGGAFTEMHPTDLLAQLLVGLVERNKLDPGLVDDVITGCVSQVGEQSASPGRVALLAAGFPEHVPSTTIDRKCGSSQQAVHFAAQGVMSGIYDIVIACGIESMSRVPMGISKLDQNPYGEGFLNRYQAGPVSQGIAAELVAAKWSISRNELDEYSARSHERAYQARETGLFEREILPIQTPNGIVNQDETIRPGTKTEKLAELKASFMNSDIETRFPQINWQVTAGNSSQISDGASALLIMSREMAGKLGLKPRARFVAFDVRGDDPVMMLTAPISSSRRAIEKSGLKKEEIDHFEVNEAFASVPLAWQREFNIDESRLNPRGGAVALGHPLGASGARLMVTMLHALEDNQQRYGLQTMCEAGGMANTTIIERLS